MTRLSQIRSVIEKVTNVRKKNCLLELHLPLTHTNNSISPRCALSLFYTS